MFLVLFLIISTNTVCGASSSRTILAGELVSRLEALEEQCAAPNLELKTENLKLKAQFEHLQTTVEKQEVRISQLQDEVKDMRQNDAEKIKTIETGLGRKARFVLDESSTVAFHATLAGANAIRHLHINQTIVFDHVLLNVGGDYHSQHGLFVANIPGIYIFSVSIMANPGGSDSTMVFIMKNGKEVAAAIADGRGSPHDQGSTTVVVQLVPGDEVWVSVQRHDDTNLWTDSLDSFMGCLISYTQ